MSVFGNGNNAEPGLEFVNSCLFLVDYANLATVQLLDADSDRLAVAMASQYKKKGYSRNFTPLS